MSTCDDCSPDLISSHRASFSLGWLTGLAKDGLDRLRAMQRVAYQRRDLRDLDDRTLSDIGLTRTDIERVPQLINEYAEKIKEIGMSPMKGFA